jgi:23S rRNA (uracil1939-C5)-methyltransferase
MPKTFEGEVYDLSQAGLGVAKGPDGRVYFIAGTWPGEVGTFEIISIKKRYGFAKLVELKLSSPFRHKTTPCKYQGSEDGSCGGCPWLPFAYEDQLHKKNSLIKNSLERSKIIHDSQLLRPIAPSPKSLAYRNRAQLKTDGKKLGFVSYKNKTLIDIDQCLVLNEECSSRLEKLRSTLPNKAWKPQNNFLWNFIDINDRDSWSVDSVQPNHRLGFMQANHEQNLFMKKWLESELEQIGDEHEAIELFCGSGNFTQILSNASNIQSVVAAEFSKESIDELNKNKLPKTTAITANLFHPNSWAELKKKQPEATLLFLDPPREGFEPIELFLKQISTIKHVIYISCDLNTFSRDAKALHSAGFQVSEIQPVDMFPNTPHVEICAHFYL